MSSRRLYTVYHMNSNWYGYIHGRSGAARVSRAARAHATVRFVGKADSRALAAETSSQAAAQMGKSHHTARNHKCGSNTGLPGYMNRRTAAERNGAPTSKTQMSKLMVRPTYTRVIHANIHARALGYLRPT